jgi:hypothetical protein
VRDTVFFAQTFAFEVFDFQSSLAAQCDGVIAHLLAQGFGEAFQIKAADVQVMEPKGQGFGLGDVDQGAGRDEAVVTTRDAVDRIGVAVEELGLEKKSGANFRIHAPTAPQTLGSGCVGLAPETRAGSEARE